MYGLIVLLPLLNSLFLLLVGRIIGKTGSIKVMLFNIIFSVILLFYIVYNLVMYHEVVFFSLGDWFFIGEIDITWEFRFDTITISMLFMILVISSVVQIYSISYMASDPHQIRFLAYLSLFTFFMVFLVTSNNFVGLFVGWEGVGLCSYLLINFWSTRVAANKAALKAMIMNRLGDSGLLLAMGLLGYYYGSLNFETLFAVIPYTSSYYFSFFGFSIEVLPLVALLCFIGVMGKSAQIGLHTWLPDAMEGPTPVSALIHAATMVTAGVFFLIRLSPLLEFVPSVLVIILLLGMLTLIVSGTISSTQNDIKKIIAYSTCSQLGLAVFLCGLSSYSVALYHLLNHAFFKALLFLIAGCIIHNFSEDQDIRRMGSFLHFFPFSYLGMFVAALSMSGLPFFSGFYSKEMFLELHSASLSMSEFHFSLYVFSLLGSFLTAFYSFRLLQYVFFLPYNGFKRNLKDLHFDSYIRLFPLIVLFFGTIICGYLLSDFFDPSNLTVFFGSILLAVSNVHLVDFHFYKMYDEFKSYISNFEWSSFFDLVFEVLESMDDLVIFSFVVLLVGFFFSVYAVFFSVFKLTYFIYNVVLFFSAKWFFDKVYNEYIALPVVRFAYVVPYFYFDKGIFERFGPFTARKFFMYFKHGIESLMDGFIYGFFFRVYLVLVLMWLTIEYIVLFDLPIDTICVILCILFQLFFFDETFRAEIDQYKQEVIYLKRERYRELLSSVSSINQRMKEVKK